MQGSGAGNSDEYRVTDVHTATTTTTAAHMQAGVHEAGAARDGHVGVEDGEGTAAAGGSERGNMRVTRAMKRAREGGADGGRAMGRHTGHAASPHGGEEALRPGQAHGAYSGHSIGCSNNDRDPPPPYLPTHPLPPHLLTTSSPVIPAPMTAEAVAQGVS